MFYGGNDSRLNQEDTDKNQQKNTGFLDIKARAFYIINILITCHGMKNYLKPLWNLFIARNIYHFNTTWTTQKF